MRAKHHVSRVATIMLAGCIFNVAGVFGANGDFNADTHAATVVLQHYYNKKGLWDTTGWWNAANCVDALEYDIMANNDTNYLATLQNTFNLNSG
ncbi:MAG: hypothetical protein ABSF51_02355, partial [Verrucomicrobiota bacterium]